MVDAQSVEQHIQIGIDFVLFFTWKPYFKANIRYSRSLNLNLEPKFSALKYNTTVQLAVYTAVLNFVI